MVTGSTRERFIRSGWLGAAVSRVSVLVFLVAFGATNARASDTSIALNCVPIPQFGAPEADPVVAVEVRVSGNNWRISHISSHGFRYERTLQYSLRDASTPGALSWVGNYFNAPNLRMVGRVIERGGEPIYDEQLYDSSKSNAVVASTQARCTSLSTAPRVGMNRQSPIDEDRNQANTVQSGVSLRQDGGVFTVSGTINSQITLDFIVDSGASDVCVPTDVVSTLIRTKTITPDDFIGSKTYQLADGSTAPSERFVIRSLKVGDKVLTDVTANIAPVAGKLLLGLSFLRRFKAWAIDNERSALLLFGEGAPPPIAAPPSAPPASPAPD